MVNSKVKKGYIVVKYIMMTLLTIFYFLLWIILVDIIDGLLDSIAKQNIVSTTIMIILLLIVIYMIIRTAIVIARLMKR